MLGLGVKKILGVDQIKKIFSEMSTSERFKNLDSKLEKKVKMFDKIQNLQLNPFDIFVRRKLLSPYTHVEFLQYLELLM